MINRLILILTLCFLVACQPDKLSGDQKWSVVGGELYFNDKQVNWHEKSVTGCSECRIEITKILHPAGPVESYKLIQSELVKAVKVTSYKALIEFNSYDKNMRFPIALSSKVDRAILKVGDNELIIGLKSNIEFEYQNKNIQLWVETFKLNSSHGQFSKEQADIQLEYLMLMEN